MEILPILQLLGGVGLFLFGMAVMTSGLRKLAGSRLRRWLANSTRTTLSGVVTGSVMTALVQSSSATTVAAIGFVGAGLISFTQSLGIIFGANIGTTFTGWMVALIGFKLKLATAALPLLFVAAICYLFKQYRPLRSLGKALGGFCLVFLGISYLQGGLENYNDVIDLGRWTADHLGGRLILLLLGIAFTLLTQSSSATVAAAITALNAGILDLPQAASVIIGADIGTTVTAAVATIGGSTASRRTGFAHVIYNLMTGVVAFLILPLYLGAVARLPEAFRDSPEVVAVSFHSFFNILGVILILPFTGWFGRTIERIFPEKQTRLARAFNRELLKDPEAAVAALELGSHQLARAVIGETIPLLEKTEKVAQPTQKTMDKLYQAIADGREFAVGIGSRGSEESEFDTTAVLNGIHLIDHLERLTDRIRDASHLGPFNERLAIHSRSLAGKLEELSAVIAEGAVTGELIQGIAAEAAQLEGDKSRYRQWIMEKGTRGEIEADKLDGELDAQRWLRRVAYHASKIAHYASLTGRT